MALTAVLIVFSLGLASLDGIRCSSLQTKTCGKGQKLEEGRCQNCELNTFNDEVAHSNDFCKPCTKYHSEFNENDCYFTIINCTRDTDTVILCGDGCYLGHNRDECLPCSTCTHKADKHIGRECQANDDTFCCPKPNMTVVLQKNKFKCVPKYPIEIDFTTSQQNMTTDAPQTSDNVTDSVMQKDSGNIWILVYILVTIFVCIIMVIIIIIVARYRVPLGNIMKRIFCKANFLPVQQSDNEDNNL